MTKKAKSEKIISEYIKKYDNYSELSSKQIARECKISQSTITRYVQNLGYKTFEEFRYNLIEEEKRSNQKSKSFKYNKLNTLEYNLQGIDVYTTEMENHNIIKKMSENKKILICYDLKYEKLAEFFLEKMNFLHGNVIIFKKESGLNYLLDKYNGECSILSIGEVPMNFYRDNIQHLEIKYVNKLRKSKKENLVYFHLMDESPQVEKNLVTLNNLAVHIVLEMLIEEYTNQVLSEKELQKMKNYLL